MAVIPFSVRQRSSFPVRHTFEHYTAAALTTGTTKHRWVAPADMRILDVIVNSGAAGSGGTSTIIDVNVNGTTIFGTQGNRPTLLTADSGYYTKAGPPSVVNVKAGDVISYDVDQIATTGPTLTNIAIVCGMPN